MQRTRITTFTGQPIVYLQPELTKIVDEDLRVSLDNAVRYSGHTRPRVSILLHLALITRIFELTHRSSMITDQWKRMTRAVMSVHDMPEAYTGEFTTGLKQVLPSFKEIEEPWERHVFKHFGLPFPGDVPDLKALLHHFDGRALVTEGWAVKHPLYEQMAANCGGPVGVWEKRAWFETSGMTADEQWDLVLTSATQTRVWT